MRVVWSPTALDQLDEIYNVIATERDTVTATKWFFKINDAVSNLAEFPLSGSSIPESALGEYFSALVGLRQLIVKPYRVIYEVDDTACNILGVMRTSQLINLRALRP